MTSFIGVQYGYQCAATHCHILLLALLLTAGNNTLISYNYSTTLISVNSGKYTQLVDATQLGTRVCEWSSSFYHTLFV